MYPVTAPAERECTLYGNARAPAENPRANHPCPSGTLVIGSWHGPPALSRVARASVGGSPYTITHDIYSATISTLQPYLLRNHIYSATISTPQPSVDDCCTFVTVPFSYFYNVIILFHTFIKNKSDMIMASSFKKYGKPL